MPHIIFTQQLGIIKTSFVRGFASIFVVSNLYMYKLEIANFIHVVKFINSFLSKNLKGLCHRWPTDVNIYFSKKSILRKAL